MAVAKLYCTFVLLLYLQGNYAQQGLTNNQNVGVNNGLGFQQQALQRTNIPNNMNQMPNGVLNINVPSQSNFQQGNMQQPISANMQGNFQQPLGLSANLQPQGGSGPLANKQFNKQGLGQLPPGFNANPSKSQTTQFNNCPRQNAPQTNQQQNMGSVSNVPMSQTLNAPFSSNSLAEIAALKGQPSLLSLFAPQNTAQPQQNQQIAMPNFNPTQNQLTDAQKQYLVRALQSQSSGQNQPGLNFMQTQFRVAGGNNQPAVAVQGQPISSQQPQSQAIITPTGNNNQPQYVTVQAQPFTAYNMQNQPLQVEEEPSMLSLLLSELQPDLPYTNYLPYVIQKKGTKSNLKTLIPLIINLLKEKNGCGCRNCGCPNNGCGTSNMPEPTIFSGYSTQKNYGQGTYESPTKSNVVEETKTKSKTKEQKNIKKNVVDSEEVSEENDSEYEDDSEGD